MRRALALPTRLATWLPGPGVAPANRPGARARVALEHAPLPIVALAPAWDGLPTVAHHVLRELARVRRVLWLSALATRAPRPPTSRLARARALLQPARRVERDLWIATPAAVSPRTAPLNRALVRATIHALRRQLGIRAFELWTFLPTTAELIGRVGEARAIYYCTDEWPLFAHLDQAAIAAAERQLLARADVVFAVGHALADRKRRHQAATYVAPHGVDHALFARALDDATPVPADIAALPAPRIGCIGAVREWVDVALLAAIARARPAWTLVLIGPVLADVRALHGLPNVHLLGARPHDALPGYCKALAAGLIPYRAEPRITYASPLALRELLAAGVPVVAPDVPEARRYAAGPHALCRVAATPADVIAALAGALTEAGPVARGVRSAAMRRETWAARAHDLVHTISELAHRPSPPRTIP